MLTKQEAKDVTLEVWRYLAAHPEIFMKDFLPIELYRKIINYRNMCPLCELFFVERSRDCPECPLKSCDHGSFYSRWYHAEETEDEKETRRINAEGIVAAVEAWKPFEQEEIC